MNTGWLLCWLAVDVVEHFAWFIKVVFASMARSYFFFGILQAAL